MSDAPNVSPVAPGSIAAIVPAAGSGRRFGDERNKLFAELAGRPLWYHAVSRLRARTEIGRVLMAVSPTDRPTFAGPFGSLVAELQVELIDGGSERTDSVAAGLDAIGADPAVRFVAVHDAARPLVSDRDLAAVFVAVAEHGAAILATPVPGTIKRDLGGQLRCETVDRRDLFVALTPQVFGLGVLTAAYAKHNGRPATDDAELVERMGHPVALVRGAPDNLKITYPEDLQVAAAILARQAEVNNA